MYSRLSGNGNRRCRCRHLVPIHERDADRGIGKELQAARNDGVEHRLGIAERVADDSQDVGGGGLLLQRFGQIVGALA
jgi:hypothetical protein